MVEKTERFEMRLDASILGRIDEWRTEQRDVPTRSEAVRRLVMAGLGRPGHAQMFQSVRFNVLCAALTEGPSKGLSDAYIYAWQSSVYPLFHEGARLHAPFSDQFAVPSEKVDELSKFLDDRWLKKETPSFYQVESYYDVRMGYGFWDRMKLIHVCRYMFLDGAFDEEFWAALLRGSDHPTEAKSITRKFERPRDIYLN